MEETCNFDYEDFRNNEVLTRACARSLEIIGEAAKNISPELKSKYENIEWRKISGLRDKVIHRYFSVDWTIVWDVIENRLPSFKKQVESILENMETS